MDALKYLGVVIDKQMNWNAHINYTVKKLSYAARIFSIIKLYINKQTLTKLYNSFAYPRINRNCVMGQCLSNLLGKNSSDAKQHHSFEEFEEESLV